MATITMPTSALIVVIDDDDSARAAMVSLVAAMGFDTRAFASASAFLTSDLRTSDIRSAAACLISDVRMPGMSGLELYRALLASGRAIPTILVTAYPDDTTRARALEAGVHGYLAKPFDPEVLLACLHEALRARPTI